VLFHPQVQIHVRSAVKAHSAPKLHERGKEIGGWRNGNWEFIAALYRIRMDSLSRSPFVHLWTTRKCGATSPRLSYIPNSTTVRNSLYFNLPKTQINRLQHIQNSLARTVANTPKYSHITSVLKSSLAENWATHTI